MRSIASMSSLSYSNTIDESTSHGMDLVTLTELYDIDKTTKPPKQIADLVGRCMLFRISAKTENLSNLQTAFPILRINTDQQLLQQHCPEIHKIPEDEVNTEMLSVGDDEFLEVKLHYCIEILSLKFRFFKDKDDDLMSYSTYKYGTQKEKTFYTTTTYKQ
nr:replication factor A protein 1-like [Ipomoea batatas]